MKESSNQTRDALCPECGNAFKAYVDRVLQSEQEMEEKQTIECPVCGCGECQIGS